MGNSEFHAHMLPFIARHPGVIGLHDAFLSGLFGYLEFHSGEAGRFRVTRIHPDGRFELSLRAAAHEQLEDDAATILAVLARPDAPRFGDRSSPDELRELFGLSKKAFKRALGGLLKRGEVTVDQDGWVRKPRI